MSMKRTKNWLLVFLTVTFCFLMLGCQSKEDKKGGTKPSNEAALTKTENLDFRLSFNKIKVTTDQNHFSGGTSIEQLRQWFGDPNKSEQRNAGNITLDSYTWVKDGAVINAQLYKNSTVARSISNFSFSREAKIGKEDYNELKIGESYKKVVEKLGEPDVLSQSMSSDKEEMQTVWSSGIKTKSSSATIVLYFENGLLKNKTQKDLE
ncbi:DUF3862 domain-containing protein [Streptococcus mutans]|uniref:DUF3862 domain-containing protein n=1 Tax=Streptococcus mutans TaxID=1309 RepID=UPI0005B3D83A|nr:DUF3862 domain-containing protein [Streptococcus mutans]MDB8629630.1 DUF3862 domain-containing protein [Streptococcus mutans]